jgi:hypothetical protein
MWMKQLTCIALQMPTRQKQILEEKPQKGKI